jgi:hypothetical protein
LLMISDQMPTTSTFVPLIGKIGNSATTKYWQRTEIAGKPQSTANTPYWGNWVRLHLGSFQAIETCGNGFDVFAIINCGSNSNEYWVMQVMQQKEIWERTRKEEQCTNWAKQSLSMSFLARDYRIKLEGSSLIRIYSSAHIVMTLSSHFKVSIAWNILFYKRTQLFLTWSVCQPDENLLLSLTFCIGINSQKWSA